VEDAEKDTRSGGEASAKPARNLYFWIHRILGQYVEFVMDIIIVGLLAVVLAIVGKTIFQLGQSLMQETRVFYVVSEMMFLFIMVEVIRILLIYLEYHRVDADTMVDVAIVSVLRELIMQDILAVEPVKLAALSLVLVVLGALRASLSLWQPWRPGQPGRG
jgi:uncharacterized membrane protein (DUF373 family)